MLTRVLEENQVRHNMVKDRVPLLNIAIETTKVIKHKALNRTTF